MYLSLSLGLSPSLPLSVSVELSEIKVLKEMVNQTGPSWWNVGLAWKLDEPGGWKTLHRHSRSAPMHPLSLFLLWAKKEFKRGPHHMPETCRRSTSICHIPMLLNLRNWFRKESHSEKNPIPWSCPKPDRSVPRHGAFRRSSRDTSDVPLADRGRERPHPGTSDVSTPPASSLGRSAAWAAKYSSSCISTSRSRMQSKNDQRKIISHHVCTNSNVLLYVCDLFFSLHIP